MAKRHILIDHGTPEPKRALCATNWELCVLCQSETGAQLECPAKSTTSAIGNGYKSLANNIIQFQELGHIPMGINTDRIDDGNGIETTMLTNNAVWHKKCHLKFNVTMIERLRKKITAQVKQADASSAVQTSSLHGKSDLTEDKCFL